jgi:adenosylcobinamide-phosphate synthase
MTLSALLAAGEAPGRAWILLAALALDAFAGEARGPLARLPHPVRLIGAAIDVLERKLNRPQRGERERFRRGALVVALLAVVALGFGVAAHNGVRAVPFAWLLEVVLVTSLLAQRSLFRHVRAVALSLSVEGLAAGRNAVARIVGRDVAALDAAGVSRAAIESCAENFSDGVVAPALWYLVLGLPGIVLYKTVNTLDSMIGHLDERFRAFGATAARLDDLMNLVPARLAGALLVIAAWIVPGADAGAARRAMLRDARRHASPNAGWPEAAMAGALGLALGGPRRYGSELVAAPWLGSGTMEAGPGAIWQALALLAAGCAIHALAVLAIALGGLSS